MLCARQCAYACPDRLALGAEIKPRNAPMQSRSSIYVDRHITRSIYMLPIRDVGGHHIDMQDLTPSSVALIVLHQFTY